MKSASCPRCGTILLTAKQRRDLIHKPPEKGERDRERQRNRQLHGPLLPSPLVHIPGDTLTTTGVATSLSPEDALRDALQYLESVGRESADPVAGSTRARPRERAQGQPHLADHDRRHGSRRRRGPLVLLAQGFPAEGHVVWDHSDRRLRTLRTPRSSSSTAPALPPLARSPRRPPLQSPITDMHRLPRDPGDFHAYALGQARRPTRLRHRVDPGREHRHVLRCRGTFTISVNAPSSLRLDGLRLRELGA